MRKGSSISFAAFINGHFASLGAFDSIATNIGQYSAPL
ncbi:hypothetical protein AJ85_06740 [Alkalihalobacillus alcalophilus ATCC 27647 = CGMCC 1.3604]|uniref:Uncharacterized protein n=1 Tax=Alkalihalobacillus alcalophilus ATCC 27647 = CGMCC 1.3604 TaxID=1218173 RepID=A0A4S4K2K2_ALKAL|nr:hypothetical protein AJ85_06740 [Alkalihalobacillus alcalophilus ATCC 27647 = CGMCC 1.3604]